MNAQKDLPTGHVWQFTKNQMISLYGPKSKNIELLSGEAEYRINAVKQILARFNEDNPRYNLLRQFFASAHIVSIMADTVHGHERLGARLERLAEFVNNEENRFALYFGEGDACRLFTAAQIASMCKQSRQTLPARLTVIETLIQRQSNKPSKFEQLKIRGLTPEDITNMIRGAYIAGNVALLDRFISPDSEGRSLLNKLRDLGINAHHVGAMLHDVGEHLASAIRCLEDLVSQQGTVYEGFQRLRDHGFDVPSIKLCTPSHAKNPSIFFYVDMTPKEKHNNRDSERKAKSKSTQVSCVQMMN